MKLSSLVLLVLVLSASEWSVAQPASPELMQHSRVLAQLAVNLNRLSTDLLKRRRPEDELYYATTMAAEASRHSQVVFYLALLVDVLPDVKRERKATVAATVNAAIQQEVASIDNSLEQIAIVPREADNPALLLETRNLRDQLTAVQGLLSERAVK